MQLPRGFADQVRQQVDIVQIVSDYVTLKRRGANYLALCPFHQEKTPSFNVHGGKQIFKCFGCGIGGDVFKFVMHIEGCGFPQAIRMLAERAGIPVPQFQEPTPEVLEEEQKQRQWREALLQINRWAQQFYQRQLGTAEGKKALDYLDARGVRRETIERLGIGYAPASWEALAAFLRQRRVPQEQIVRSGLVVQRSDGQGHYDRFRDRIMFPITDAQGRVIAFGGRVLEEDAQRGGPKYLNSPETAVYTKGRHLFGLGQAKEAIRRAGAAILVEGYLDFLIPFQAGVENVVASLGTALTGTQVSLLKRFTSELIVNFDPDPAGRAAAMRSLQTLLQRGLTVRIVVLPQGEDPDSFIRRFGADAYTGCLSRAQSALDFVIAQATAASDLNEPRARAQSFREILPYVALISDRIERAASGDHVANRLRLDPKLVQKEIARYVHGRRDSRRSRRQPEPDSGSLVSTPAPITDAERLLLEILLTQPALAERLRELLKKNAKALKQAVAAPLFAEILDCLDAAQPLEYSVLAQRLQAHAELLDVVERCCLADLRQDVDVLYQHAQGCLESLERNRLEHEMKELQQQVEAAQQRGDWELSTQLLVRMLELKNLLSKIVSGQTVEVDAQGLASP